ncbi:hypothetical protein ABH926_001539 [Catenulispora sp. GP43]|uniref:hypothetical protein n=1 Tax=Catenulispora sp. GP43 TaxID=3156263 RepID=UPI0035120AC6
MGTEQPDTERMHRLFDDALDDVDLTGDVVPGVLTGYAHRVKVRRYQAAGVALAVLATTGAAVSALPHRGDAVAPASVSQEADYCTHQHWVSTPNPGTVVVNDLAKSPAADQANCEAMRAALRSAFPGAQLIPDYQADLTLDSRIDQTLVKKDHDELSYVDPIKGSADQTKDFGSELKYLAVHPEDPANVYYPDGYTLVTAAGRAQLSIRSATDATLGKTTRCSTVGVTGGWHGPLCQAYGYNTTWQLSAVLTGRQGKTVEFAFGDDDTAWYREGAYTGTLADRADKNTKWINRWTGKTAVGQNPPVSHVVTLEQAGSFLDSSAFQKYADGYLAYLDNLPTS